MFESADFWSASLIYQLFEAGTTRQGIKRKQDWSISLHSVSVRNMTQVHTLHTPENGKSLENQAPAWRGTPLTGAGRNEAARGLTGRLHYFKTTENPSAINVPILTVAGCLLECTKKLEFMNIISLWLFRIVPDGQKRSLQGVPGDELLNDDQMQVRFSRQAERGGEILRKLRID